MGGGIGEDRENRFFLAAKHRSECGGRWLVGLGNGDYGRYFCSTDDSSGVYNEENFPRGVWTHLAATYDGREVKFYRDGDPLETRPQTVSGQGDAQRPHVTTTQRRSSCRAGGV